MKHKRKCIEKRMYLMRNAAEDIAIKIYIQQGRYMGIYECPMCLAFHLQSDASTLPYLFKRRLQKIALRNWFPHWNRKHVNEMVQERQAKQRSFYQINERGERMIRGVLPEKSLTLEEQHEALKQLAQ